MGGEGPRVRGSFAPGEGLRPEPPLSPEGSARLSRLDALHAAAVRAAHHALSRLREEVPISGERVLLWVSLRGSCEDADRAFWATASDRGGALASPGRFATTLPSSIAGAVALTLGLTGPVVVTPGEEHAAGAPLEAEQLADGSDLALLHLFVDASAGALATPRRVGFDARAPQRDVGRGLSSPEGE